MPVLTAVNILGADSATLTLTNVQPTDCGRYSVVAYNASDGVISDVAEVLVTEHRGQPAFVLRSGVGDAGQVRVLAHGHCLRAATIETARWKEKGHRYDPMAFRVAKIRACCSGRD